MAELWALLHFIMPTLFDSHEQFNQWFSKGYGAPSLLWHPMLQAAADAGVVVVFRSFSSVALPACSGPPLCSLATLYLKGLLAIYEIAFMLCLRRYPELKGMLSMEAS